MKINSSSKHSSPRISRFLATLTCGALVVAVTPLANAARHPTRPASQDQAAAAKIPPEQLDSLVAPIALVSRQPAQPDAGGLDLSAGNHSAPAVAGKRIQTRKDKEAGDAVKKQPWDPSIQAMAALPDVVKRLADDIQWTTDLGNAFLAQQS